MKKKIKAVLILIIIIIIIGGFVLINYYSDSCEIIVKTNGNEVETTVVSLPFHNKEKLSRECGDYTVHSISEYESNIYTLKGNLTSIANRNNYTHVKVSVYSQFGEGIVPFISQVKGTSMEPTYHNNQIIVVEKTGNITVGDVVVAYTSEYGPIIKRVSEIRGNEVYLTSDNKNITIEYIDGEEYTLRGLNTWTSKSNIIGIAHPYNRNKMDISNISTSQ